MTKRHHKTSFHRCGVCGRPLVKELTVCKKCGQAGREGLAVNPEPLVCPQCGGDPYCKEGCPNQDAFGFPKEVLDADPVEPSEPQDS